MKKTKLSLTIGLTMLITTLGFSQITGSDHDFSGETWNNTGQICIVCHTPHNADITVPEAPLWNHEVTQATFTLYGSPSFDGSTTIGQPSGASKLCLSCHDGTVAMDNFGGRTNGSDFASGSILIGTDLSGDHPISFDYTTALATTDGGLHDPSTANSGLGGTIDDDLLLAGQLQCSSCHDVHNGSGLNNLLRISNAGSALCLTCHNK